MDKTTKAFHRLARSADAAEVIAYFKAYILAFKKLPDDDRKLYYELGRQSIMKELISYSEDDK